MTFTVTVAGGSGALNDGYIQWRETELDVTENDTVQIWVEPDANESDKGLVKSGTSGFPSGDHISLWEVDTDSSDITSRTDKRPIYLKERVVDTDMEHRTTFTLDDNDLTFTPGYAISDESITVDEKNLDFRFTGQYEPNASPYEGGAATTTTYES